MKRLAIIGALLAAAALAYAFVQQRPTQIALLDAVAHALPTNPSMFMLGVTIRNSGPPDELIAVTSPTGATLSLMNSTSPGAPLIIPGEGAAVLAMDGAHIMMTGAGSDFVAGALLPVTLHFRAAGKQATRVRHAGLSPMSHDPADGVQVTPTPTLQLALTGTPSRSGTGITLHTTDIALVQRDDAAPHVAGEGHAHIYLNGLKLARIYGNSFQIGALPPGTYLLRVSLNTNDHRAYRGPDGPIEASLQFTLPE